MSQYLTRDDLAELVGCQPRSIGCMKRWLVRNKWPFEINIAGFPQVSRQYRDARMNGASPRTVARVADEEQEPDYAALET